MQIARNHCDLDSKFKIAYSVFKTKQLYSIISLSLQENIIGMFGCLKLQCQNTLLILPYRSIFYTH